MDNEEQDLHVRTEMFRSVMTAAHAALKNVVIINGGAAVATLAFVGPLVQKGLPVSCFGGALGCFALGVLFAGLATGFTYITQSKYYEVISTQPASSEEVMRKGKPWRRLTVACCILSYVMFLAGCGFGVCGLAPSE